jgi:vesicle-fusing ATPase
VGSKYIGETEKNLDLVFQEAEGAGAVLVVDDGDALFGRLSDVKDSHDRIAAADVASLARRVSAYRGLAIVQANMKQSIDPAFIRRLRHLVEFPLPSPVDRRASWDDGTRPLGEPGDPDLAQRIQKK